MNIYVWIPEFLFLSLLGICLGMELLDQMVILCLTFWRTAKLFSIAAIPFYISTSNVRVSISPHLHQHLLFSFFFFFFFWDNNHPRRYEVVSHCSFGLHLAQRVKHLSAMQETQVRSLGQGDPLEKEMATQYWKYYFRYYCLENPTDG